MLKKRLPEQEVEVTIWQRQYSVETRQLTITYSAWGNQYAHRFTEEETNNWVDDEDMLTLLYSRCGIIVVE
jgi:hypothetical protein